MNSHQSPCKWLIVLLILSGPLFSEELSQGNGSTGPVADSQPMEEFKPRLVFAPEDVIASRTRELGQRLVTFEKVSPLELPPVISAPPVPTSPTEEGTGDSGVAARHFGFITATTYLSEDAPNSPRTYVRYWPTPGAPPVSLWVNANLLWLTGFAEFASGEDSYSLLLAITQASVQQLADVPSRAASEYQAPALPAFPGDEQATFVVVGGTPTEADLAPIRGMIDFYNRDKERLRLAYQGRMAAVAEKEQELKDNPPSKKNLVVRYWRLDQAGQNGATTKPATIR